MEGVMDGQAVNAKFAALPWGPSPHGVSRASTVLRAGATTARVSLPRAAPVTTGVPASRRFGFARAPGPALAPASGTLSDGSLPLPLMAAPSSAPPDDGSQGGQGAWTITPRTAKYVALTVLVLQNSVMTQLMRHTRTTGVQYSPTVAVLMMEMSKLLVCLILTRKDGRNGAPTLRECTFGSPVDVVKLTLPSLLYVLQNNLQYVALSHLPASVYQSLSQLKILTTAACAVTILGTRLSRVQWLSLPLLMAAVTLVQGNVSSGATQGGVPIGLMAIIARAICSGLAGVYFEMMLKKRPAEGRAMPTLWMRQIQMGLSATLFAAVSVLTSLGWSGLSSAFVGFTPLVWAVIALQGIGGLAVAAAVKYADNIVKNFATPYAMILSLLFEVVCVGYRPSARVIVGTLIINASTLMYAGLLHFPSRSQPEAGHTDPQPITAKFHQPHAPAASTPPRHTPIDGSTPGLCTGRSRDLALHNLFDALMAGA